MLFGIFDCKQQKLSLTNASKTQFLIILSQNKRTVREKSRKWKAGQPGAVKMVLQVLSAEDPTTWKSSLSCGLSTPPLLQMISQEPLFCITPSRFKALGRNTCRCPSCREMIASFSFYGGICDTASHVF